MKRNASRLCKIWNTVLVNSKIDVCVDEMKDLGFSDVRILKLIYQKPGENIKTYLDILQIPNSTFTNALNRLIKKNFLLRKMDEHDLRSYTLELTEFGKQAIEKHLDEEELLFDNTLKHLSITEQEMLLELLEKLISNN